MPWHQNFSRIVNDFRNQPAVYEAQVWLSRVAIINRQFIEASEILSMLNNNASFPEKLLPELYTTYADYYFKQKDYTNGINFLEKTLGT